MLRIGAVAYAPYVVTIFEGLKRHFHREGVELDWVLYSNYDALVTAFVTREVDLAWNGPLAYVKIRRALAEPCRVVAMRDIDVGYTTQFITQCRSSIQQIADLLRDDILFCATDFPHEPRTEFHENLEKFMAREDIARETKQKICCENPKRMYPLSQG